jgi:ribosomal protein S18 acetylase RimI-like enzyme
MSREGRGERAPGDAATGGRASARVSLRPATDADVPFLLALREQTMTAHQLASGLQPTSLEREQRVRYRYECAQIVEREGRAAGLFKVARDGLQWQLVQIQLAPELQGQGVGEALIRGLIAEARGAGASLRLNVLHQNPARHLYERLGFVVVNDGEHEYEMRLGEERQGATGSEEIIEPL